MVVLLVMGLRFPSSVCVLAALALGCAPKPAPSVHTAAPSPPPTREPWDLSIPRARPPTEPKPLAPTPRAPLVPRIPKPGALRVGPSLSEQALAAGIYTLGHVPFAWPAKDVTPRKAHEPLVVPVGRPVSLPLPPPIAGEEQGPVSSGYGDQITFTKSGVLEMTQAVVDLSAWTKADDEGKLVLTPPRDWEGLVQLRAGTALVAYGQQGLSNYREYVRRYLPWRAKQRTLPTYWSERPGAHVETMLATLMTGDIDADGTPELIAYSFAEWKDEAGNSVGPDCEIGIVWRAPKKEPAVLTGFAEQPGIFAVPVVVPPRLNGGRPFVFSREYCCAATHVRWAIPEPGTSSDPTTEGDDGDWSVYLEPTTAGDAKLVVAVGEQVDWRNLRDPAQ
jgi:hypothetical protein